jgi:TolB protein
MKIKLLALSFLLSVGMTNAQNPVGIFSDHGDVGNPKNKGGATYSEQTQTYSIKGAGYNIWFERDEFHFAHQKLKGDFILTANFGFNGAGVDPHRKIGWMVRESLDERAAHVSATLHGDGLTVLQWRELRGAFMRDPQDEIFSPKSNYTIIQLERSGKELIMRAAHFGEPLQLIGSHKMPDMPDEVFAGIFVGSHNPDVVEEGIAWNVRIDKPLPDSYNPYREGWLGARLETMTIADGKRTVIYEKEKGFEAPNWMPDGKKLLFNMDGSIYTIPLTGGEPQQLNTGDLKRNNNDHGISFDGKMLAISSHRDGLPGGGSTVYVLPLTGGTPDLVTEKTPSYFHGWAPNNREVVYVAQRGEAKGYNIYKANIKTKVETQLTTFTHGHVDGCEYSPDGKYIYYNGSQSGTMQLWRMKADGTGQEQLTFDANNDWFPHISPDGKWILYISFPPTIPVNDHPPYKRVELKIMPAAGGESKVLAYLYGGQGTINTPSWSPDSKSVAFVSNSGKKISSAVR